MLSWRELATLNPVLADGHLFVGFADWRSDAGAYLAAGGAFFPFELDVSADADVAIQAALGGGPTRFAGAKLESINGVAAREVSRELLRRAHGDTPEFRAELISRRWFFYYWKLYGSSAEFDLELRGAQRSSIRVPASTAKPLFVAREASFEDQFSFQLLPCATALLTIRSFDWPDKKRDFEFTTNDPLRYTGKTYVLIGRYTYSSAILFANTVRHFGFATPGGHGRIRASRPERRRPKNCSAEHGTGRLRKTDSPAAQSAASLDRRVSVAPMMDWTDDHEIVSCINSLASSEKACLLYVSAKPQLHEFYEAAPNALILSAIYACRPDDFTRVVYSFRRCHWRRLGIVSSGRFENTRDLPGAR